jgi:hypothetical protein
MVKTAIIDDVAIRQSSKASFGELVFQRCDVSRSKVSFDDAPRVSSNIEETLNGAMKGWIFRAVDSLIEIPAFSSGTPIKKVMLSGLMELSGCKVAGLQVEDSAKLGGIWPTSEGVLFSVSEERRSRSAPIRRQGGFIIVDRGAFLKDEKVAEQAIADVSGAFGEWISSWVVQAREELGIRSQKPRKCDA